jgi:hypothetical protein
VFLNAAKSLSQGSDTLLPIIACWSINGAMAKMPSEQHHTPDKVGPSNNIVTVQGKIDADFLPITSPPLKHPM